MLTLRKLLFVISFAVLFQVFFDSAHGKKNRERNLRRKSKSIFSNRQGSELQSEAKIVKNKSSTHDRFHPRESKKFWRRIHQRRGKYERKRTNKNINILKTSQKAKIITEKRYLKKDWCKSQLVKQRIQTTSNCRGLIINQFCYGQCNSFYIPKDIIIDPDEKIAPDYFKSCSFCKPKKEEWISVRLRCRNIKRTKMPRFLTKRIKRVKGCTCIAVPDLDVENAREEIIKSENENEEVIPLTNLPATEISSRASNREETKII